MLFSDATIPTETPPLRACWSPAGQQAEVPVTGNRAKTVLYGALNPATGRLWLDEAPTWNQHTFQEHLRSVRSVWRGWRIVLREPARRIVVGLDPKRALAFAELLRAPARRTPPAHRSHSCMKLRTASR